jgi:hypothetical protein
LKVTSKSCIKCRESKELDNFYPSKYQKYGRRSVCIECSKKISKYYRDKNKAVFGVCKGF